MSKKEIKLGVIGLGKRGMDLMFLSVDLGRNIRVTAVCDEYYERAMNAAEQIKLKTGNAPEIVTTDYKEVITSGKVDCVIVATAWEDHVRVSVEAMKAGVIVGCEVGGAYSVDDCYELVRTYEETNTPFMLLENCCYGRKELMALDMKRKGIFGKISHCTGSYNHDLREEILGGYTTKHYRLRNYIRRNCENYPTHELGPIAKILDINRGNRMISLVSVASKSNGMKEYVKEHAKDIPELLDTDFRQGDIINTIITCANGETILLTLDTTLPRYGSRNFSVRGTKGGYFEENDSVYLEADGNDPETPWRPNWGNGLKYFNEHKPALWEKYGEEAVNSGHGGMDYMVLSAFYESIETGAPMPIDVYDAASWMVISCLSEASLACGSFVAIPDFTRGGWTKYNKPEKKPETEFWLND